MKEAWVENYHVIHNLGTKIMRIFALALNLPENFFDEKVDKNFSNFVANYYPPLLGPPLPGQIRAGAHSDWGTLTLLQLDPDSTGGLQVKRKDEWVAVPYLPDSFVINIGDVMAQWTNDHWVSTLHRVVNPPPELSIRERMSLAFFYEPNYDAVV